MLYMGEGRGQCPKQDEFTLQGKGAATQTKNSANLTKGLERISNMLANIAEKEAMLNKIGQVISVKGD